MKETTDKSIGCFIIGKWLDGGFNQLNCNNKVFARDKIK